MSRRPPNPNAERTAQNTATIKSLLKLEGNKTCADCKRNKHPRWASWNLGIFICIRCSGIHRGMGTHISRVKSIDLDSWTDEQLQSVLRWGNAKANKYWESKLAPGHVPSEAKIENFIRTKYESKRWVMEGPMPDPSTLEVDGDDDVPLNLVKEKHNLDRSTSQRSATQTSGPSQVKRATQPDFFAEDAIPRSSSTGPGNRIPPKAEAAPPKQTKPADSLLGLDFFGTPDPAQSRPASTVSAPGGPSRPDLKQSILSLYSTAPKPQPTQQSHQAFGGFVSPQSPPPNQTSHMHSTSQSSFGGMQDAFSSLSFSQPTQPQNSKTSAFAGLGDLSSSKSTPSISSPPSTGFGGNFFGSKPANKPPSIPAVQSNKSFNSSSGFGGFESGSSQMPQIKASSGLEDLFDFGSTSTNAPPPRQTIASPLAQNISVFNLSAPQPVSKPTPQPPAVSSIGWGNNTDAWGSNDAWSTPDPTPQPHSPPINKPLPPMQTQASSNDFGWGSSSGNSLANQSIVPGGGGGFNQVSSPPKVSADEDFGGWSSAVPVTSAANTLPTTKTGSGFGASEDLFSNVWE